MSGGPPAPYKSGDVLNNGRYVVEEEINRGATAVVYAGRDAKHGNRPVALKVLDCPQHVPVRVVRREIALSSAVGGHPHLAALLDVFAASRRELVVVWERVEGPDLLTLLNEKGGPLEEGHAAFLLAQLLRAVAFLHKSGYAHRDIKPENALVERATGRLRLIDFGLSKHIASVATLGVGTPDYMAPELLQQQQHLPIAANNNNNSANNNSANNDDDDKQQPPPPYDARAADAWALGVLLFLLLAGAYPFEDERHPSSVAHTVSNVLAARRRPLPGWVSAEAARVVAGLLERDPRARTDLRALASDPWLAGGAEGYARGVPGGMALVDLSAVAGRRAAEGQQQQQQQQQRAAAAEGVAPPAAPPAAPVVAKGGGGGSQGEAERQQAQPKASLVQRLMVSVGLRKQ